MGGHLSKDEEQLTMEDVTQAQLSMLSNYAKKSDLPSLSDYAKKSDLTDYVSKSDPKCSVLVNGIHWCDGALHSELDVHPMTFTEVFKANEAEGFCVGVKNVDMSGFLPPSIRGDGDIPDNFLCFEKNVLNEYSDAFVDKRFRDIQLDAMGNPKIKDIMKDMAPVPSSRRHERL